MSGTSAMIMLADALPESLILAMLSAAIVEYQAEKNKETAAKLHDCLSLTILKLMAENHGVEKITAEMDQIARIRDMFKALN